MPQLTFQQRCERASEIANDKLLDSKDVLVWLYHWAWTEYHIHRIEQHSLKHNKHARKAQKKIDIFNFQHELEDL